MDLNQKKVGFYEQMADLVLSTVTLTYINHRKNGLKKQKGISILKTCFCNQ